MSPAAPEGCPLRSLTYATPSARTYRPRAPLERRLREIAAALIVFAERTLRDAALSSHAYRVQRKAELEEARRKQGGGGAPPT